MSLNFDGVNDVVTLTTQTFGSARSFVAWILPNTQGEGSEGRIFTHSSLRSRFSFDSTPNSKKLRFSSNRATDGIWDMTTGFTTLAVWHFVAMTYDGTLTTNDPIMYVSEGAAALSVLAVGSGLTETSTPSGSEVSDGDTFETGSLGGLFAYDGLIGEVAVWANRILTAEEVAAIFHLGVQAVAGAHLYWPMDDTGTAHATDFSGNGRNGTITEAVVGANPPVRPAGRAG